MSVSTSTMDSSFTAAYGCGDSQDQNLLSSVMLWQSARHAGKHISCCTGTGSLLNQRLGKTTTVCYQTLLSSLSSNPAE